METDRGGQRSRVVKGRLRQLLTRRDTVAALEEITLLPIKTVINALFSFLQDGDPGIKWPAVKCFGVAVTVLADQDIESARIIMRRLMWSLNDESGGIGWGAPEAMGEVLARHHVLAIEYAPILLSYARQDGNYLELDRLQRGLLWGIARAAESRPELFRSGAEHLMSYLGSPDATVRGLASRVMGLLRIPEACLLLGELSRDRSEISIDFRDEIGKHDVKGLAEEALKTIPCP